MDYVYVAMFDGYPIATAHTIEDIGNMLDEYNGVYKGISKRLRYEPYNSKYPSINDLEGVYYYKENNSETEDVFKVYGVEYLNHGIAH